MRMGVVLDCAASLYHVCSTTIRCLVGRDGPLTMSVLKTKVDPFLMGATRQRNGRSPLQTLYLGVMTLLILMAMMISLTGCELSRHREDPAPQNRMVGATLWRMLATSHEHPVGLSAESNTQKWKGFHLPWEGAQLTLDLPEWLVNLSLKLPGGWPIAQQRASQWQTPIALPPPLPFPGVGTAGYITGLGQTPVPYIDVTPADMAALKSDPVAVSALVQTSVNQGVSLTTGPRLHLGEPVTLQTAIHWWSSFHDLMTTPDQTLPAIQSANEEVREKGLLTQLQAAWPSATLQQPVTRELACWLMAAVSGKLITAEAMTPVAMANTMPPNPSGGLEKSRYRLSAWLDAATVSPWARSSVAVAYHEGWLRDYFGLTPATLTEDQGFGPKTVLTRAEWLHIAACFANATRG
jgi:hypothetical protein